MYKAGRQQEINFRFTRLPRLFDCKFNDEIMSEPKKKTKSKTQKQNKKQRKEEEKKFSCHYKRNQARIKEYILTGK